MTATMLETTDRPIHWAGVAPTGETVTGQTIVGAITVVADGLTAYSDEDEATFVAALDATDWPPLPASGWLEASDIYEYDGAAVMVRQSHNRTEWPPEDTPALFIVWREAAGALDWIAGEQVYVGTRRLYESIEYECLQTHVTQADWTPPATPALWRVVVEPTDEWAPSVWYEIGAIATYLGIEYECIQAHTSQLGWEPPSVPALWVLV